MDRHTYADTLTSMHESLTDKQSDEFRRAFRSVEKNPVAIYGFNIWLGTFGVDRFVIGDILLGILKLITLGGFGIWVLIDCFIIGNRTRTKNLVKAQVIFDQIKSRG